MKNNRFVFAYIQKKSSILRKLPIFKFSEILLYLTKEFGGGFMECKYCGGKGYFELFHGTETCPSCQGTGKKSTENKQSDLVAKLQPLKK